MRKLVMAAVAASSIASGCQSKPIEQMSYTELKTLAGDIVKRCMEQGVKLDTPEMNDCNRQEAIRERATREDNRRRRAVVAQALGEAGENMQRQADRQALVNAAQAGNRISCTSTGYGNAVQTNCY